MYILSPYQNTLPDTSLPLVEGWMKLYLFSAKNQTKTVTQMKTLPADPHHFTTAYYHISALVEGVA